MNILSGIDPLTTSNLKTSSSKLSPFLSEHYNSTWCFWHMSLAEPLSHVILCKWQVTIAKQYMKTIRTNGFDSVHHSAFGQESYSEAWFGLTNTGQINTHKESEARDSIISGKWMLGLTNHDFKIIRMVKLMGIKRVGPNIQWRLITVCERSGFITTFSSYVCLFKIYISQIGLISRNWVYVYAVTRSKNTTKKSPTRQVFFNEASYFANFGIRIRHSGVE